MKKFKQLVMVFLVGVVSFGFTACSDNNNFRKFELPEVGQATVNVSSSDKEMQKVAKVYVNQVVYPTYQALAANARTLYTTTAALYTAAESGTMTQAQIDAACEAFKDTPTPARSSLSVSSRLPTRASRDSVRFPCAARVSTATPTTDMAAAWTRTLRPTAMATAICSLCITL